MMAPTFNTWKSVLLAQEVPDGADAAEDFLEILLSGIIGQVAEVKAGVADARAIWSLPWALFIALLFWPLFVVPAGRAGLGRLRFVEAEDRKNLLHQRELGGRSGLAPPAATLPAVFTRAFVTAALALAVRAALLVGGLTIAAALPRALAIRVWFSVVRHKK